MNGVRSDVRCLVPDGTTSTVCMQCPWSCGIHVRIEAGLPTLITGNKAHPYSKGIVCPKGAASPEVMLHPKRITQPMRREGTTWKTIDWDEA